MTDQPLHRNFPVVSIQRGGIRFLTAEEGEALRWRPALPSPPPDLCPNGCCSHAGVEHTEHPDDDGTMVCTCYGCPCAPGVRILDAPPAGQRWDVRLVPIEGPTS